MLYKTLFVLERRICTWAACTYEHSYISYVYECRFCDNAITQNSLIYAHIYLQDILVNVSPEILICYHCFIIDSLSIHIPIWICESYVLVRFQSETYDSLSIQVKDEFARVMYLYNFNSRVHYIRLEGQNFYVKFDWKFTLPNIGFYLCNGEVRWWLSSNFHILYSFFTHKENSKYMTNCLTKRLLLAIFFFFLIKLDFLFFWRAPSLTTPSLVPNQTLTPKLVPHFLYPYYLLSEISSDFTAGLGGCILIWLFQCFIVEDWLSMNYYISIWFYRIYRVNSIELNGIIVDNSAP